MKTGNKKQAIVLSIVALAAIGFLVMQVLPSKVKNSLAAITGRTPDVVATQVPTNLPLALIGDPFSHPKLAVKPPVPVQTGQPALNGRIGVFHPPAVPDANGDSGSGTGSGAGGNTGGSSGTNSDSGTTSGPAENAGGSQQKQQGPQITVLAVMQAGTPVAELQVANNDAQMYSEGALLAKGTRLLKISESGVEIRLNGVVHKIATGETYSADDGESK